MRTRRRREAEEEEEDDSDNEADEEIPAVLKGGASSIALGEENSTIVVSLVVTKLGYSIFCTGLLDITTPILYIVYLKVLRNYWSFIFSCKNFLF